jgi:hypothetical protein
MRCRIIIEAAVEQVTLKRHKQRMISIRLPDNIAVAVTEMAEAFVFEEKVSVSQGVAY